MTNDFLLCSLFYSFDCQFVLVFFYLPSCFVLCFLFFMICCWAFLFVVLFFLFALMFCDTLLCFEICCCVLHFRADINVWCSPVSWAPRKLTVCLLATSISNETLGHYFHKSLLTCLHVFPASEVINTLTLLLVSSEPIEPEENTPLTEQTENKLQ